MGKAYEESNDGFQKVTRQRIATAAPEYLFKVDNNASKLSPDEAKSFHSIIAMMMNVTKRVLEYLVNIRPIDLLECYVTTRSLDIYWPSGYKVSNKGRER